MYRPWRRSSGPSVRIAAAPGPASGFSFRAGCSANSRPSDTRAGMGVASNRVLPTTYDALARSWIRFKAWSTRRRWWDTYSTDLERHLRLVLEDIHTIRERIPVMDMLVGTLAEGAEEVAIARALLQRAPQEGPSGLLGFWKKNEVAKGQQSSCFRLQRAFTRYTCPRCAPASRFRRPGTLCARLPPSPSAAPRSGHARLEAPPSPAQRHVGTPHSETHVCPPCAFGHSAL